MRSFTEATPLFLCLTAFALGCSSDVQDSSIFIGTRGGATGSGAGTGSGAATGGPGTVSSGGSLSVGVGGVGGGASGGIDGCVGTSSATTPVPPILGFLIDTSGSMGERPLGDGTPTKWESTLTALTTAFTNIAEGTGAGLLYYPNVEDRAMPCFDPQIAVPIAAVNMAQRTAILNSLTRARIRGNTPTHEAYRFAVQTMEASTLIGSKYVVLVTDGAPTYSIGCVGDGRASVDATPIVMEAAIALTRGIKTFVIGSPGSETARTSLSQMATQGGTPLAGCSDAGPNYCHFDMTTAPDLSTALNAAFAAITGQVVSCAYTIPAATGNNIVDTKLVNVNVTGSTGTVTPVPKAPGMECTQGWQFSDDMKQIKLCPETCNQIKADMGAKVDIVLGCTGITL